MNRSTAAFIVLSFLASGLFGQEATLESKVSQVQIGKSTIEDLVRVFGEPERYGFGRETFVRDKLPERYSASYSNGIRISVIRGRVQSMQITKPGCRVAGGIQVGSPVAELVQLLGAPKEIVKGPAPAEGQMQAGVLYEGGAGKPGLYWLPDRGLAFVLTDGKVVVISVTKAEEVSRKEELVDRGPGDPCRSSTKGEIRRPAELPRFDASARPPASPSLCEMDLTALDLRQRDADLLMSHFDRTTVWPARDRLPAGFDPQRILELGRNPGLGVRTLHKRGITGAGVSIALVDNPLAPNHKEYASRLRFHESINIPKDQPPNFHGGFALSVAAGETVGVAPGADIYYISSAAMDSEGITFTPRAKAFERLLEVNKSLPPEKKIRVISMSIGWQPQQRGAREMDAAAKKARDEGIFVITGNLQQMPGFRFQGLGREPLADPDRFESYLPGELWGRAFYDSTPGADRLLAPMDSRTGASPKADDNYYFDRIGGLSWAMPYLAGVYALAVQVDPGITPDRFWQTALKTGRTIQVNHGGQTYSLGRIIDPVALVAALEKR